MTQKNIPNESSALIKPVSDEKLPALRGEVVKSGLALTSTRRQFLATSSLATAGLLLKPIEGFTTTPSVWGDIKGFFTSFGKNILFNLFDNFLPGALAGFAPLANQALGQVLNGGFTGWNYVPDCFGNGQQDSLLVKLLGLVGSGRKLNAAVPYLNKEVPNAVKLLFSLPAFTGLSDIVEGILGKKENLAGITFPEPPVRFLNAGFSESHWYRAQEADVKQRFFLPRSDGRFSKYALQTMTEPKPLSKPFDKPHLFESEVGTVVLIDYELGQTQTDKAGKIKAGDGKAIIYVIAPANKRNLTVPADPNFLADRAKVKNLKERIVGQGLLAAGSTGEGMTFKFEVE